MIIKGGSRGGPSQLAKHLLRTDTNETVRVLQLNWPAGDLEQAFRDWQALSAGTRGKKGLYPVSIDPQIGYAMTDEQWLRSADVTARELGLNGQPRAIVLHEKKGRQHIHVVWARTDVSTMTLRSDSQNYKAHERASLALEREFGHEHVPGKHAKRDRKKPPPKAKITHDEWQQAERAGEDINARRAAMRELAEKCDTGQAFRAALEETGQLLAQGDKARYLIVDKAGRFHNLARELNMTAAEAREFMADVKLSALPTLEEAQVLQRKRAEAPAPVPPEPSREEPEAESAPSPTVSPADLEKIRGAHQARQQQETRKLAEAQATEAAETARILDRENTEKLAALDREQQAARERFDREQAPDTGRLAQFIAKLRARFMPERVAAETRERETTRASFIAFQQQRRGEEQEHWQKARDTDLASLAERHAQQLRELEVRLKEDSDRRLRHHEEAQRFLARIEEERKRQEELAKSQAPPGPTR